MSENELVSLNEIRERFETDDIELVANTKALVEVTIYPEKGERGNLNVRLHFGRVNEDINRESPFYVYVAFLDWAEDPEDIQTVFDINPDERIWSAQEREGMNLEEAWSFMEEAEREIVCVKKRSVEIALYRAQDRKGELLPNMGIQLHFGDVDGVVEEGSDAYNFPAWMDSAYAPSPKGMFTIDDIPVAFDIDPNEKIWVIGDPG